MDAPAAERALPPPARLDRLFLLDSWGVPPEDTVVTFAADEPRVVILRRGAPDNSVFAALDFPPGVLVPPDGRPSATLSIRPRPGAYGLDLIMEPGSRMRPGATITFSYAVHFVMPDGARQRYRTPIEFERELLVVQVGGDGSATFLPSRRPASDHLAAMLTGPGRYVVAAPR